MTQERRVIKSDKKRYYLYIAAAAVAAALIVATLVTAGPLTMDGVDQWMQLALKLLGEFVAFGAAVLAALNIDWPVGGSPGDHAA